MSTAKNSTDVAGVLHDEGARSRVRLIVMAAIGIGIALRVINANEKGLWLDEIYTATAAYRPLSFSDLWYNFLLVDPHPPLYQFLINGWAAVFGLSDAAFRASSVVTGIAALFVMLFVARRALGERAAIAATILTAFSWPALYYSHEVRSYELVFLVSTVLSGAWVLSLRDIDAEKAAWRRHLTVLGVASFVGAALHLYGFILGSFALFYLAVAAWRDGQRARARQAVFVLAGLTVVFGAWQITNMWHMREMLGLGSSAAEPPRLQFFLDLIATIYHHPIPVALLGVLPLVLGLPGAWAEVRTAFAKLDLRHPAVAFTSFVFPFAALFIFSQVQPIMYTRHLIVFFPGWIMLVALVFARRRHLSDWRGDAALLAAGLLSLIWVLPDHYTYRYKPQNRESAAYMLEHMIPGTALAGYCVPDRTGPCEPSAETGAVILRMARHLHYLNYATLPEWRIGVDTYDSEDGLRALVESYAAAERPRIIVFGARKWERMPKEGLPVIEAAGYGCRHVDRFLKTSILVCDRAQAGG